MPCRTRRRAGIRNARPDCWDARSTSRQLSACCIGMAGRLVTITGPAGVGKTRLALEVGHRISRESVHSVTFVDLSSVRDPALVPPAVASADGPQDPESPRLQERSRG